MNSAVSQATPAAGSIKRARRIPAPILLWGLVVVANLAGILVAVFASNLIRSVPDQASTETTWRVVYYAAMFVVATVDAFWLDEIVFKGAFRRTQIMGRGKGVSSRKAASDEEVADVAATFQKTTVTFPMLLIVSGVVTYLLFNAFNQNFDRYWRDVGQHVAVLRTTDDASLEARKDAIDKISFRRDPVVLPLLVDLLEREDETAVWAAWALGRHYEDPQAGQLIRPLVDASRSDDPELRREALVALARIQHRGIAQPLQAELQAELDDPEKDVDLRLIWGLGYIQHLSSIEILERALYHQDTEVTRVAAWALAQHRDLREGRQVVEILEKRLPAASVELRCAITLALGIMADEHSNLALMDALDAVPMEQQQTVCETTDIHVSPDGESTDTHILFKPRDLYAIITLRSMGSMRATDPAVRRKVEPWLRAISRNDNHSLATRQSADSLLAGIENVRDDRIEQPAE